MESSTAVIRRFSIGSHRRQRSFKLAILCFTSLVIALVLGLMPKGRYVAAAAQSKARQAVRAHGRAPLPTERNRQQLA